MRMPELDRRKPRRAAIVTTGMLPWALRRINAAAVVLAPRRRHHFLDAVKRCRLRRRLLRMT